jgi:hypothetical protein
MKPEKSNKLITLWALALLLMAPCITWAQKAKEAAPAPSSGMAVEPSKQKTAADQVKNNKSDSDNPIVNQLNQHILEQKAVLERGVADKSLSNEEIEVIKADIAFTERKVKTLTSGAAPAQYNSKGQMVITREQYANFPDDKQREIAGSQKYEIADLTNGTPATLTARIAGLFYMTVDQFNSAPFEKKVQILQNPETYIIVNNTSEIPKIVMSRAELNSLPAAKQQSIVNSGDFKIVD